MKQIAACFVRPVFHKLGNNEVLGWSFSLQMVVG
jgi:hypothetical protein